MKKNVLKALAAILIIFLASSVSAGEKATKEECVAKAKEAAALLSSKGLDETIKAIQDPEGKFVWKDTYVFCMAVSTGEMLAHPIKPRLVGKKLLGIKDMNGKMLVLEYVKQAKEHGEGWTDYMWPKPGEKKPSKKLTYTYMVPGTDILFGAGIYE